MKAFPTYVLLSYIQIGLNNSGKKKNLPTQTKVVNENIKRF